MKIKRKITKSICIALSAMLVFCSIFSFASSEKLYATDFSMESIPGLPEGSTAESVLQAIRYIILGSGIRRSGYSTTASINTVYHVIYDMQNNNEFVLTDEQYQQFKSVYDNTDRYKFLDVLSVEAYRDYLTEYEEVGGEFQPVHIPTEQELNDTANILTYILDTGIATLKDGILYVKNTIVNDFGDWISDNAEEINSGLEEYWYESK